MRQVSFSFRTGDVELVDLPYPAVIPNQVVIGTTTSLMSAGTERMLLSFGRAGWIEKIRQQPDRFREVLDKIRSDGLLSTLEAVRMKLDQPIALGYCNVGTVLAVGAGVSEYRVGDRVISNGAHADVVRVPRTLCAKIPDEVSDEAAVFSVVSAIGLQGVRLAQPTLGEHFVVIGLGLIGLLTCQILSAAGCNVLGCDFDANRLRLARQFGADTFDLSAEADPVSWVLARTNGRGADGVLITASTESNAPVTRAAQMSRQRGRIVLVGVAGLNLSRADFYEKEISFQVSCSYGPGRYDTSYEQGGNDYPLGFVRWTAQRNFEAVLQLLAAGRLQVEPLISHRYAFDESGAAYRTLLDDANALGILLQYAYEGREAAPNRRTISLSGAPSTPQTSRINVAFFGAGNYASRVLIPCFARAGADLNVLVNTGSIQGVSAGRRYGFSTFSTDPDTALDDERVSAIVIATRHDSHAPLAIRAIEAGKHVFVEKPLALTLQNLDSVQAALQRKWTAGAAIQFCVGFNRRFAPLAVKMRTLLHGSSGPKSIIYTVNAGAIPAKHWTQQSDAGGGRIVGECCHFIDFLRFLVGAPIEEFHAYSMSSAGAPHDTVTITLRFADGSIGTVHYFSNGSRAFAKERVEVFAGGSTVQLDNFRSLRGFGWRKGNTLRAWRQDKGQQHLVNGFVKRIKDGGDQLIAPQEIFEVMRISILAQQAIDAQ
jgi:predicted dehydrogenase/threonine dehydrogenase-like Zn-dependent dehydrogenase